MGVRTAATMTTSSAELIWRRALPSEGRAEVMDWRVEDMVATVEVLLWMRERKLG
jgi:hypothetical protein